MNLEHLKLNIESEMRGGCADSIVGVTIFREEDPIEFGSFSRSFCALFRIVAGETWFQNL
jgi:hypothetical protein